jgi:hypothetical protein
MRDNIGTDKQYILYGGTKFADPIKSFVANATRRSHEVMILFTDGDANDVDTCSEYMKNNMPKNATICIVCVGPEKISLRDVQKYENCKNCLTFNHGPNLFAEITEWVSARSRIVS